MTLEDAVIEYHTNKITTIYDADKKIILNGKED